MIKIEVLEEIRNNETEWQTYLRGRATFQGILVPNKQDDFQKNVEALLFRRIMDDQQFGVHLEVKEDTGPTTEPEDAASKKGDGESIFADAK